MVTTLSEMTKLWDKTLNSLKKKVDNNTFDTFFANSYIYDKDGNKITIVAPNKVAKVVVGSQYLKQVIDSLSEFEDDDFEIEVISAEDVNEYRKQEKKSTEQPVKKNQYFADAKIREDLKFSNFVVGEFNKDAHKAALYVAKNGGTMFNPLFIYSHSGLGKTHLLHAIANEVLETRMPNAKILYTTADGFVEEYIKYIKSDRDSQSLKDYFKGIDMLLIDDIQFLAEKVKTSEMFFFVFNELIKNGKRIIITADKQPNELKGLEERLVTRFTQGLTVKINEPDIDTCVEILKQKIANAGMDVEKFDANVIYFLAEKFSRDVRELEGAINALAFSCIDLLDEDRITMDVAIKAVASIKGGKHIANQLNERKIISVVADYYNLTPAQIMGKDRNAQVVLARHIAMYLIRNNLDIPLKKVGEMFGGKDHTTVMNALTKVDKELKTDSQLQTAIKELEKKIKE